MEPSPLTQQARPEVFQQKIVELYENLFKASEVSIYTPPFEPPSYTPFQKADV